MASPTKSSSIELNVSSSMKIQHEVNSDVCKYYDVIATLPSSKVPFGMDYFNYGNFWYPPYFLCATMAIQQTFKPLPLDVFVATYPKSGTTWIKALVFAIVNRTRFAFDQHHPLLLSSPHACVPSLEVVYHQRKSADINSDDPSSPRLFGMHIPYSALPLSMKNSNCQMIYLCRDPKDTFISDYHFLCKLHGKANVPLNETFEMFCKGYGFTGPIWDNILEYWMESSRQPENILFLKYEELKAETVKNVIKVAEFAGYPFTQEEKKKGVVKDIIELCSFENLSKVDANQNEINDGFME